MRFLVPVFVFLAVAAFHSALSASLESAEKEDVVAQQDGLTKLQEIDQLEFEAAQKNEAAQMNVTEEQSEGARYLEAVQDGSVEERVEADAANTEGGGKSDASARGESSESSEEADGRQRRGECSCKSTLEHKKMMEHQEAAAETVSTSAEGSQDSTKEDVAD
uniref:neurofilament medium polypeptide isoform X2 n=1 Tax=Semicossyphus pulcher TaxID=241346 RepID=UPI0037E84150